MKREDGFTLIEALVATAMMLVVMFALYAALDAAVRMSRTGRDGTEALQNARLGMDRMERDIRAAHPVDAASGDLYVFFRRSDLAPVFPSSSSITFGNDLDGRDGGGNRLDANGKIECSSGSSCEFITYDTYRSSGAAYDSLARRIGSTRQAVADHLRDTDGDGRSLTFEYLDADSNPATEEKDISIVRIRMEVAVGEREQVLTSEVSLRNRED